MTPENASNLANTIVKTWKSGPEYSVWRKFLEEEIEDSESAVQAVRILQRQDIDRINLGKFFSTYTARVVRHIDWRHAHQTCVACEGTGYITIMKPSRVTDALISHSDECVQAVNPSNQAEHNYYFGTIAPEHGHRVAAQMAHHHVDDDGHCTRCRMWSMPCTACRVTTQHAADTTQVQPTHDHST